MDSTIPYRCFLLFITKISLAWHGSGVLSALQSARLLLFQPSKYFQLTQDSTKALWCQLPGWLHLLLNEDDRTDMWTQLSIRTMYQDRALWLIFTVQGLITYRPVYQKLPIIAINAPGIWGIPGISTARHPIKQNFYTPRLHCIVAEWTILHCRIKWQYGTFRFCSLLQMLEVAIVAL